MFLQVDLVIVLAILNLALQFLCGSATINVHHGACESKKSCYDWCVLVTVSSPKTFWLARSAKKLAGNVNGCRVTAQWPRSSNVNMLCIWRQKSNV